MVNRSSPRLARKRVSDEVEGVSISKPKRTSSRTPNGRILACSSQAAKPYRNPITGEVGINEPLNKTHIVGGSTRRISTKVLPSDPFKVMAIPENIGNSYKILRNVKQFYDWQVECLCDHRMLRGSNFILSLPTGAGKTLVAELLIIRTLLTLKRSCILILPFVAIVQEKTTGLHKLEEEMGFSIEEYANTRGRIPPLRRKQKSLYVCTIEKANVLINSLISEDRIGEIGLVIVDELHMIGENKRGTILEQTLNKLLFKGSCQIVGMSATLSSLGKLKKFLSAHIYATNFRPVKLNEFMKIGTQLFYYNEESGGFDYKKDVKRLLDAKVDPDGLVPLIAPVIPQKSILIFCPSKENCENLCQMLSRNVPKPVRDHRAVEKLEIIEQIMESNDGVICPVMKSGIKSGIAYHHSGLTRDERILVENAFKSGIICVICATSTLAAGVNLPARRVIIRSPKVGRDFIGKAQYLQMIGRAGRAGLDDQGESFVIVQEMERSNFLKMRYDELPEIVSGMADIAKLESFILDLLALKVCKNEEDIQAALRMSFLEDEDAIKMISEALERLIKMGMITDELTVTELGLASSKGAFEPTSSPNIYNELVKALDKGLVLSSHFHLLCTIAPLDVDLPVVDFNLFYQDFNSLSYGEKLLLVEWGIDHNSIMKCIISRPRLNAGDYRLRVYIAFMLRNLWAAENLSTVADRFKVSRGWLNSTVQSALSYANQLTRFVNEVPQLWAYRQLLPELLQKLNVCARQELVPLLEIDCVKRSRAQQLFDLGYKNVGAVSRATPEELTRKIKCLGMPQAQRIVASAKAIFRDLVAEKAEELKQIGLLDGDETKDKEDLVVKSATPVKFRPRHSENRENMLSESC
ncbi:unnamed protein product [Bursaphelenchus xylophilus]|uniref:(pine wood nematode) hypothetical protein n=1 Tax=Bursaphelenchus xylophilus TaxID=6326 RepID=A0A811LUZ0_BURXY|nr:unnamed protein product [Bursaphelenchus xylophilus]CAG9123508.1 unnamed protein product [Bursaphelenchus xylophilus]